LTIAYFDASALVKLVVDEEGSATAVAVWDASTAVIASLLAYPEVQRRSRPHDSTKGSWRPPSRSATHTGRALAPSS
jgi:predicted nucleic acid-binding protein